MGQPYRLIGEEAEVQRPRELPRVTLPLKVRAGTQLGFQILAHNLSHYIDHTASTT